MADIVVVDDDAFTRHGLRAYLESLQYQVREAGDIQTAWELFLAAPPQAAIIDVRVPLTAAASMGKPPTEPNGIALAQKLKQSYPTMGIVLFSAHEAYEREVIRLAQQYMRSIAFLHKGGDMRQLHVALTEVMAGRTLFQADLVNRYVLETAVRTHFQSEESLWIDQALSEFEHLTPREQEVAHLLAASYQSEHIAQRLSLSKGSVDNLVSRIYIKLGLSDMKQETAGLRPLSILIKACLLHDIREQ